jgi:hypothetical protein
MLGFTGDHEIRRNRFFLETQTNKNPPDLLTSCSKTSSSLPLRRTKFFRDPRSTRTLLIS